MAAQITVSTLALVAAQHIDTNMVSFGSMGTDINMALNMTLPW